MTPPLGISESELKLWEQDLRALFAKLGSERHFRLIDLIRQTCESGHCAIVQGEISLYVDYNHISRTAVQLAPLFSPLR